MIFRHRCALLRQVIGSVGCGGRFSAAIGRPPRLEPLIGEQKRKLWFCGVGKPRRTVPFDLRGLHLKEKAKLPPKYS